MPPETSAAIRVATFDCYGTLVDWEGGLGSFLYDKALRSRAEPLAPGRELRERWEAIQFELILREYRPYREILADSVRLLWAEGGDKPPWRVAAGRDRRRSRVARPLGPCRVRRIDGYIGPTPTATWRRAFV